MQTRLHLCVWTQPKIMQFKKITISDYSKISEYFEFQPYQTCDFTNLGLYMWINYFNYEFAIDDETLFMRENSEKGIKYFVPISKKHSLSESLERLINDQGGCLGKLVLSAVPEILIREIENHFNSTISLMRDWSDYIYNAQDLLLLQGKKYGKKRNLIHQFINLYECSFEPIGESNIDKLIAFLERNNAIIDLSLASYENRETIEVLKNYDKFNNLYGYVFYVNAEVIGFTICECRNDVCFIHVEKGSKEHKGSSQYIFWKTINEIFAKQKFEYINREEDVGDSGLRKAKMSYYPIKLLNKFEVEIDIKNS